MNLITFLICFFVLLAVLRVVHVLWNLLRDWAYGLEPGHHEHYFWAACGCAWDDNLRDVSVFFSRLRQEIMAFFAR